MRKEGKGRFPQEVMGVGLDVVDITRMDRVMDRWGARFTERVFTAGEIGYARNRPRPSQHFSARFAAKEAVMKAMGTGFREGARMRDVEVLADPSGRPRVSLHGGAREIALRRGVEKIMISLSHTGDTALAQAVAVGRADNEEDDDAIS